MPNILKITSLVLLACMLVTALALINKTPDSPENQSFFNQFVLSGGAIVWFVMLPMSLITVYLSTDYLLTINRRKLLPPDDSLLFDPAKNIVSANLEADLAPRTDLVSTSLKKAITCGRGDWYRMQSSLFESLEEQTLKLLRKIEWINLIGNVSPMVGLFGTVFGMIKLFNAIVTATGQPQPAKLAGGISVALVTTFWGLLIAIPALAVHGIFRNRIESIISDATSLAEKQLAQIRITLEKQRLAVQVRQKQQIREVPLKPAKNKPASAM